MSAIKFGFFSGKNSRVIFDLFHAVLRPRLIPTGPIGRLVRPSADPGSGADIATVRIQLTAPPPAPKSTSPAR